MSEVGKDVDDSAELTNDIAQYFTDRELNHYGAVVLGLLPKRVGE